MKWEIEKLDLILLGMVITSSEASVQSMEPSQKYSAGMHLPFEQPMCVSLAQSAISNRGFGILVSRTKSLHSIGV